MRRTRALFLHGFTGRGSSWSGVLERLPAEVESWCPDLLGHDPDRVEEPEDFEGEVERLAAGLEERGWRDVILAGYSMGARVALVLLVHRPELFRSALLIGVHPGLDGAAERVARAAADEQLARRLERDGVAAFVDAWQDLPLFASQRRLPPAVLEAQRRTRLEHRAGGLARALRVLGLAQMPIDPHDLASVEVPVTFMVGEEDAKFRGVATTLVEKLPRAALRTVPGAGHNLIIEAPRALAAAIEESYDE